MATLSELNPGGIDVTVRIVADSGVITHREVIANFCAESPVNLRGDLIQYMEVLAKGGEVTELT